MIEPNRVTPRTFANVNIKFEKNQEGKPISVIISTLAARAYEGETDLPSAMRNILSKMGDHVGNTIPRVPNPVNPKEDFADKWDTAEGKRLGLKDNFWDWLEDAKSTFEVFEAKLDAKVLEAKALQAFGARIDSDVISEQVRANDLASKAKLISLGASTSSTGVIGTSGIRNQPHKFYGEEL